MGREAFGPGHLQRCLGSRGAFGPGHLQRCLGAKVVLSLAALGRGGDLRARRGVAARRFFSVVFISVCCRVRKGVDLLGLGLGAQANQLVRVEGLFEGFNPNPNFVGGCVAI